MNAKRSSLLLISKATRALRHRFSLIEDKASDTQIDTSIRSGVVLQGTNLWVLIFAILVASIGLNVNSTAVIIGAMLISPLMGPIMGIGYGVGIYDQELIRRSFRNLGIATAISLTVSTIYFFLTPLSDAQSELLARTSPTIWDVLIAFFGGLAGIIGATRSEKTNIIPGVAIATALMPPLCTAGYGLANANWEFFFGAFYLYSINCVFIAFASILIIWVLNPTHKTFVDEKTETRVSRILTTVVLLTLLPSVYLAVKLVKEEVFQAKASQFLAREVVFDQTHVTQRSINAKQKKIEITLIGEYISKAKLKEIESRLSDFGLTGATLTVYQSKDQSVDVSALKSNIVSELYKENLYELENKNKTIRELEAKISATETVKAEWRNISAELHAQYPQIREVLFSEAVQWKVGESPADEKVIVLNISASSKLSRSDQYRISEWLKVRIKTNNIKLIIE
ncbi:MAG: TIGR00341 family protein [Methylotenera sp.]|nr:TIGR00341 family protein [Methylotenera sp.]